ncbi:hypothetical protein KPK_4739 [Klebsiella variicola]|uniref:Uncharacterized protein n=1 Tax=Klebsiella variicola (strain 342) TaxID=507522 RepID=B5Y238_KLEV3|nr:hypothetical protein KPK_4739 [Klebsiella variicola]
MLNFVKETRESGFFYARHLPPVTRAGAASATPAHAGRLSGFGKQ